MKICLISAQNVTDPHVMPLEQTDIENGSLNRKSFLPYLFTISEGRIARKVGTFKPSKLTEAVETIKSIL